MSDKTEMVNKIRFGGKKIQKNLKNESLAWSKESLPPLLDWMHADLEKVLLL